MKGFKDVIILFLITAISALCLSLVYNGTQAKIEESKSREVEDALKNVAPFITGGFDLVEFDYNGEKIPIYAPPADSGISGAGLKIRTPEGFSGDIVFLMGVDGDGKITGFQIIESKETPGLGTKAADRAFWGQFVGRSLDGFKFKVKKDGGDVDAITASTITSRAVTHAMEKGLQIYKAYRGAQ